MREQDSRQKRHPLLGVKALTRREQNVVGFLGGYLCYRDRSGMGDLRAEIVRIQVRNIFSKLGVHTTNAPVTRIALVDKRVTHPGY
jgi:DNA-binding NarL/FixJ family response regulator